VGFELLKIGNKDKVKILAVCKGNIDQSRRVEHLDLKIKNYWATDSQENIFAMVAPSNNIREDSLRYYFYCFDHLLEIHNINIGNKLSIHNFPEILEEKREEIKEIMSIVLRSYGVFINDPMHGKRNEDAVSKYPELAEKAAPFPMFVEDNIQIPMNI
jgi:hypothetical protein